MIAELQTVFRWSARRVGKMTLREVERLYLYWQRSPHEHRAAAMHLQATTNWKPPEKPKPFRETTREEFLNLALQAGR